MSDFKVEIRGLKELQTALKNYPQISEPILQKTIVTTGPILGKNTQKGIVSWRTGFLNSSFRLQIGRLQLRWGPTVKYAGYVQFGTKAHNIFPIIKLALADKKEGLMFGKHVHHPGTKANDFMGRILEKSTPEINLLFAKALDEINRRIADSTK